MIVLFTRQICAKNLLSTNIYLESMCTIKINMIWKEKINMICSDDHFGLHGTIYSVYLSNRENGVIGLLEGVIEWIYIKCME